jgi:glyoxylase-like metal-dependent hydrolase (beta-lactamase superfamily II)
MVQEQVKEVELHLGYAGACSASEHHAIRGGKRKKITFHALWGLIRHPEKGYVLFDTGYTRRFHQATKRYPNRLYSLLTPVEITQQEEIMSQLRQNGIEPHEIKYIVLSHFHADHTGGLRDFPHAEIICSRVAFEHTISLNKRFAFRHGVLLDLLPDNLKERITFIEDSDPIEHHLLGRTYDLFGDQSLLSVPLPGHAAGQTGLLLKTHTSSYLLIADACWLHPSFRENRTPHPIVRLFFHSWKDFVNSLNRVHHFHLQQPDVRIVPTHCKETTDPLVGKKITFDAL